MSKKQKNKPFAKKSLGQNFLVDPNYIRKILEAVNPKNDELIIEIGAGRGALTEGLVNSGANVVAIELDKDLIPILKDEFGNFENFNLIENDALKIDFDQLKNQNSKFKTKLAANLPYYISTAILQHLIRYRESFSEMFLMLQKEVVERITAEAGKKQHGFLTVLIEAYFSAEKLFDVPPNAFHPAPKIHSSVIRLRPKITDPVLEKNGQLFREIISAGFRHKRKTIFNNLKNADEILYNKELTEILNEIEIDPKRRAETLTLPEWIALTEKISDAE